MYKMCDEVGRHAWSVKARRNGLWWLLSVSCRFHFTGLLGEIGLARPPSRPCPSTPTASRALECRCCGPLRRPCGCGRRRCATTRRARTVRSLTRRGRWLPQSRARCLPAALPPHAGLPIDFENPMRVMRLGRHIRAVLCITMYNVRRLCIVHLQARVVIAHSPLCPDCRRMPKS